MASSNPTPARSADALQAATFDAGGATETAPATEAAIAVETATATAAAAGATSAPAPAPAHRPDLPRSVRVAIIGGGFGGVDSAIQLMKAGERDFVILERDQQVAGCWQANTYPGVACDVPSNLYSYSFAPNPDWSRTYSPGGEIAQYIQRTAEEFGVLPYVRFGVSFQGARWVEDDQQWEVTTDQGTIRAQFLINATGPLTEPAFPEIKGRASFKGIQMHSARWDHSADLAGKRIAVIGTGASAIQFVPEIQEQAGHIDLYQRTAPWVLPRLDRDTRAPERALFRRLPITQKAIRGAVYAICELIVLNMRGNRRARAFMSMVGRKHLERQVKDPVKRELLRPGFAIGCKRILFSNRWYPAVTAPNVSIVSDAITEIREGGVVTADGAYREVDAIIYGTGFHVTDAPIGGYVTGRSGRTLAAHWDGSPKAYLGVATDDFPNLFHLVGPNSGLGHSSIVMIIEWQVKYAVEAIRRAKSQGFSSLAPKPQTMAKWTAEIDRLSAGTVWTSGGCASYYIDKTGRNSSVWPTYTWKLKERLDRFDSTDYELTRAKVPAAA